jgi:hypothetical protein
LVFSPLDNRDPEKVPGARKIVSREKEREPGNDEKCQGKGTINFNFRILGVRMIEITFSGEEDSPCL